jgi:hypothetical protein
MTSIVGSRPSSMIRAVVSRPMRRMRSTKKADSATTRSTLPSSEGWKLKPGSSIHDREPRVAWATSSTRRISPIIVP